MTIQVIHKGYHPGAAWSEIDIRFQTTHAYVLGVVPYPHTRVHEVEKDIFIQYWPHNEGWFSVLVEPNDVWTRER